MGTPSPARRHWAAAPRAPKLEPGRPAGHHEPGALVRAQRTECYCTSNRRHVAPRAGACLRMAVPALRPGTHGSSELQAQPAHVRPTGLPPPPPGPAVPARAGAALRPPGPGGRASAGRPQEASARPQARPRLPHVAGGGRVSCFGGNVELCFKSFLSFLQQFSFP